MKKIIFITGAGQGIGRAVAIKFAKNGWRVCATDIQKEALDTLKSEIGDTHYFATLDVTDAEAVAAVLAEAVKPSRGKIDALLNNAGILFDDHFEEISLAKHDALVNVNVKGVLYCAHAAFDYLKLAPNSTLINMSSASSQFGVASIASYSASKFFVKGLTEALAVEWKRHGIHVCSIAPNFVTTTMTQGDERTDIFKENAITVTAEDVAEAVWQATQSRNKYEWHVENKASRFRRISAPMMPRSYVRKMMAKAAGYPE